MKMILIVVLLPYLQHCDYPLKYSLYFVVQSCIVLVGTVLFLYLKNTFFNVFFFLYRNIES